MNPIRKLRETLERDTGKVAATALIVLTLLYFFDEFDTAAFGTLAPDIRHAFHLSLHDFTAIVILNASLLLLLAIPVSQLGDRVKRVPLVVISGILAGLFSFGTGIVMSLGLLVTMRFGNGLGLLANGPIHNSLLADYYEPEQRGLVFADHANGVNIGAIVGPAFAGILGALFGWRAAFMVLIVPILVTTYFVSRLKEPVRGGTDDPDSAIEANEEKMKFRESARALWTVKTLRRQFIAAVFLGAGLIPLGSYLPNYLHDVYHLGDFPRGIIGAANAAFTFWGVRKGGKWTAGWFAKGMGEPLRRAGYALVLTGIGLALVAAAPWLPLALAFGFATSFAIGTYTAPQLATQALVSPARARTLSFGFASLFLVFGVVFLFNGLPIAHVADDHGLRWGVFVLVPYWVIGGAILASASRFVKDDAARALRSLNAMVALRQQRLAAGDRSLLLCAGVDVAYDSVQVLFGVDFEVKEGEAVALLGTNGAGKSTLLKAISGLQPVAGGAVFFDGHEITQFDARAAAKLGIVQMPGGRSIFPTLTVNESLRLASWMYKRRDPKFVAAATEKVLEYFPILRERGDQLAGNLSGGEQQMLGLGMAFIAKPRLLMIDELSLGLAPAIVSQLIDIVKQMHREGTTIILVEQSVNVALTVAERAVFMEKGEVRFSGPTADLLDRGDILRSVFLEGAQSHTNGNGNGDANGKNGKANGKKPAAAAKRVLDLRDKPVALELLEVSKSFGGIRAVDRVSFELHENEILGVIGPNGAGKTTVFDLISGFLIPDGGVIRMGSNEIGAWSADRRARVGLGRSFQDARLFPSLTVAECIAVALERHLEFRDPLACALGLPSVAESEVEVAWQVHELIELLGLGAFRNKFVSELSTGSRRVVDLAMTMAHRPSILILDEPSSGIAQRETEALGPLLQRIQREAGCAMLVIEHDMPLVTSISNTMLALELGGVVTIGLPDDVVNHPDVVASYLGTDDTTIARSGALSTAARKSTPRRRTKASMN
ncbi:MAG TPA: MFS transporter [Acidimicrobiales bacterium]|nr:MFS transporter [Acidimicrobiales bacterium]